MSEKSPNCIHPSGQVRSLALVLSFFVMMLGTPALFAEKGEPVLDPPTVSSEKTFSPEAFLESKAGKLLKEGRYGEAIPELEKLLAEYPDEILIRRYLGIAFFKTENYDEAVNMFQSGLLRSPHNAALHFYLAETLLTQQRFQDAKDEYQFVLLTDEWGKYAASAEARLEILELPPEEIILHIEPLGAEAPKRWNLRIGVGYEYDSNATLNPSDALLKELADQNAGRYQTELEGRLRLFENQNWMVETDYTYAQSLYDDSLWNLNTYINSWGASVTRVLPVGNKPLILQLRESLTHVILEEKFFVFIGTLTSMAIYDIHPQWQLIAVYAFSHNEYEDNTENRLVFGRDGLSHNVILLNTHSFNPDKTFRVTWGYDYQYDDTQGQNFVRHVNGARGSLHFPLIKKFESDVSFRYSHDDRPTYLADTENGPRRDDIWEFTTSFIRKIGKYVTVKLFYTFERAFSKNNSFEYTRSFGGTSINVEF
ncbi:MAG: tetratricopeptide repeat protein [Candidatus Omnitrophica bacterium]|nr:tetratricopeptide repeat protein [Candidatus Omnitrophota bacterium]